VVTGVQTCALPISWAFDSHLHVDFSAEIILH